MDKASAPTPLSQDPAALRGQVRNLRITFWGVQGSCPTFPSNVEMTDYARQVALHTLRRAVDDLARRAVGDGADLTQFLHTLDVPAALAAYQGQLGLPQRPVYGGDTTCVEVETAEGDTLLFDLGTGVRDFSLQALARRRMPGAGGSGAGGSGAGGRILHVFGSHEHLDHRSGMAFAAFNFVRDDPFTVHMYGTGAFLRALDDRYGLYSKEVRPATHQDDPLDYRVFAAKFTGTEIRAREHAARCGAADPWQVRDVSEPIRINHTTVTPFEVYHGPTECLAYKVCHGDASFVFCTDHELRHGEDPNDPRQRKSMAAEARLVEQCGGVNVAYFDGQYFLAEYLGLKGIGNSPAVSRMDWGHGCIEDVVARVQKCRIGRAYVGHHDPERHWAERIELDRHLARLCDANAFCIELAKADAVIDL